MKDDLPYSSTTWLAQIFNGSTQSIQPVFGVECLKATGVSLVLGFKEQLFGPIAPQSASGIIPITCPAGYITSGGGFEIDSGAPTYTIMNNAPNLTDPATWLPEFYNTGNAPITMFLRIVCFSAPNLHRQVIQQLPNNGSLNSNQIYQANAYCPAGYVIGDGGLDSGYSDLYENIGGPNGTTEWSEYMFYAGPGTAEAQIDATCLKIG